MTKWETRKAAKTSILDGRTKQETFDELKETSGIEAEDLAKIIQSIPSLQARQKYKGLYITIIALLSLTILFKVLAGVPIVIENGIRWFPILFLFPIINIFLLWGVVTYSPGIYRFVAMITIIGLIRAFTDLNLIEPLALIDLAIAAGLIGIGFYLNAKLCPGYQIIKEPYENNEGESRLRNVIRIEE